jgi:ubiquinone/menaquinone biosynthesis C-methylase UbiE
VEQTATSSGSWAGGDRYEAYVGRWSRLVARQFLAELAVPAGRRWLDVGCGTGALTGTLLAVAHPRSVPGVDTSADFGATGPAPAYVASLGDADRVALREGLRKRLPVQDDGAIHLAARAWTVRGRVPADS